MRQMLEREFIQQLILLQQDIEATPALHPQFATERNRWASRLSDLISRRLAALEIEGSD
jgi:hypothetical protein